MANGHFLLFILRQREKSAISVRKKHKFQTENKTLHKMFGKTLDSGGRIRYNKVYPNGARCAVWEIGEGGGNVMTKCKGAVMMGSLSFGDNRQGAPFRDEEHLCLPDGEGGFDFHEESCSHHGQRQ
ncbi:MAG: hypothetical protein ACLT74_07700 [Christensenellales bacterium]